MSKMGQEILAQLRGEDESRKKQKETIQRHMDYEAKEAWDNRNNKPKYERANRTGQKLQTSKPYNAKGDPRTTRLEGLPRTAKEVFYREQATGKVPQFMQGFSRELVDGLTFPVTGGIAVANILAKNKDSKGGFIEKNNPYLAPYENEMRKSIPYRVGAFTGSGVALAPMGGMGEGKIVKALSKTQLGKKFFEAIGKISNPFLRGATREIAENIIGETTVGAVQNLGLNLADGLRGKELLDQTIADAGLDILAGSVLGGTLGGVGEAVSAKALKKAELSGNGIDTKTPAAYNGYTDEVGIKEIKEGTENVAQRYSNQGNALRRPGGTEVLRDVEGNIQPRRVEVVGSERNASGGFQAIDRVAHGANVLVSEQADAFKRNKISLAEAHNLSYEPESFVGKLKENSSTQRYGVCVYTDYEPKDLKSSKLFTTGNGNITIGVHADGDIFALSKKSGANANLDEAMYLAIANGGRKMDAYGIKLAQTYQDYGFEPVARVPFDENVIRGMSNSVEEADAQINLLKELRRDGKGADVYVFMHNGDSIDDIISRRTNKEYKFWTQEELDNLKTFDDYEDALAYRDNLIKEKNRILPPRNTQPPKAPDIKKGEIPQPTSPLPEQKMPPRGDVRAEYRANQEAYETYPHGTPKQVEGFGPVTKGVDTARGSGITAETRRILDEEVLGGRYTKDTISNKKIMEEVNADLKVNSVDRMAGALAEKVSAGTKTTQKDIAMGIELFKRYDAAGEVDKALEVLDDVAAMTSESGRTLQAARLFYSQTPAGKVKMVQRLANKLGNKYGLPIVVDDSLLKQLYNATEEADIIKIQKDISVSLWNQVPPTFAEKVDAWRYTAMLSSPKTHLRNIIGNSAMMMGKSISDTIEAGMQKTLFAGKLKKLDGIRTKSVVGWSKNDRALRDYASDVWKKYKVTITESPSKYFDTVTARPMEAKHFGNSVLGKMGEGGSKFVGGLLEAEDKMFIGVNFRNSLAQIMKANKVTAETITEAQLSKFVDIAREQAEMATFRDANALAEAVNGLRKWSNGTGKTASGTFGRRVLKGTLDATVPFVRTPLNVLKQGLRYSPEGFIEGLFRAAKAKDAESLIKGIEIMSNGITGTAGLTLAGYILAQRGMVNGSLGEFTDPKTAYDRMNGKQDFALNIGGKSITLDWVAPFSMPFFVGVAMGESKLGEDFDAWDIVDSMGSVMEPFMEMSMVSGLNNVFKQNYSVKNGTMAFASNIATSYINQFFPAVTTQLARTMAKTETTSSVKGGDASEKFMKKTWAQIVSKIPGLYSTNPEKVDLWGETNTKETAKDYIDAAFKNFISPASIKDLKGTEVDKEISRLYEVLDDENASVLPKIANDGRTTVKHDKVSYEMSQEDYTNYSKTLGKESNRELQNLFKSSEYKKAEDWKKREMIKRVYQNAKVEAKKNYLVSSGEMTEEQYSYSTLADSRKAYVDNNKNVSATDLAGAVGAVSKAGFSASSNIAKAYVALDNGYSEDVVKGLDTSDNGIKDMHILRAKYLKAAGVDAETFETAKHAINTDHNTTISYAEIRAYLDGNKKYTRQQKAAIWYALSRQDTKYNPYN